MSAARPPPERAALGPASDGFTVVRSGGVSGQSLLREVTHLLNRFGDLAHKTADRVRSDVNERAQSELLGLLRSDPGQAREQGPEEEGEQSQVPTGPH
jgi:hypothetical protein